LLRILLLLMPLLALGFKAAPFVGQSLGFLGELGLDILRPRAA